MAEGGRGLYCTAVYWLAQAFSSQGHCSSSMCYTFLGLLASTDFSHSWWGSCHASELRLLGQGCLESLLLLLMVDAFHIKCVLVQMRLGGATCARYVYAHAGRQLALSAH